MLRLSSLLFEVSLSIRNLATNAAAVRARRLPRIQVVREGGAFRLDSLLFDDVTLGLAALLAELCDAGAGDVVLTLDEYEDV